MLAKVKGDDSVKVLDLGCGMGQNLRKLIFDGVPQDQIFGSDFAQGLIKAGKDFFRDETKLKTEIVTADIFDSQALSNTQSEGRFDYIWTAMFYHLWDWEKQKQASIQTAKFLKDQKGATVFGWQLGAKPTLAEDRTDASGRRSKLRVTYKHDEESFKKLWNEVGRELSIKFKVEAMGVVNEHTRKNVESLKGSTEVILVYTVSRA